MAETEAKAQKAEVKKVSRVKTVKKSWFKLISPSSLGQKELGETYLPSAEHALGRVVDVGLKEITGNVKDQNAYLRFKVKSLSQGNLQTELMGYFLTQAYVRRAVKKNTNRIDSFVVVRSMDGKEVIVKSLLITQHKDQRSLRAHLQRELHRFLAEEVGKTEFDAFMNALAYGKVQQALRKRLNKLYPLREAALREVSINSSNKKRAISPLLSRVEENSSELPQEEDSAAAEVTAE